MEIRQIKYFAEVARTLNFSRAAEQLFISQPTLSQQIMALEKELGVELLLRNRRKVELTRAGRVFMDYCVKILDLVNEAEIKIGSIENKSNMFVIGVDESSPHLDKQQFFSKLEDFHVEWPNYRFSLKILPYDELFSAMDNGEVDACLAIVVSDEYDKIPCQKKVLSHQRLALCVPKAFADKYGENCFEEAVCELDLCLASNDPRWARIFIRILERMGFKCHPSYMNSYHSICNYVEAGYGFMGDTESCIAEDRLKFSTPLWINPKEVEALDVLLWSDKSENPLLPEFIRMYE